MRPKAVKPTSEALSVARKPQASVFKYRSTLDFSIGVNRQSGVHAAHNVEIRRVLMGVGALGASAQLAACQCDAASAQIGMCWRARRVNMWALL